MDRITTGLDGLDKLISGGFPPKTVILLSGGPGTGKTLAGMKFIVEGAEKGEKCCYLSLMENKEDLLRAAEAIDSLKPFKDFIGKNLSIEVLTIGEDSVTSLSYFTGLFSNYPKVDRLVIDNVNKLLIAATTKQEYRIKLGRIIKFLKEKVNCTLILCETPDNEIDTGNGEAFDCDGVVKLSFLEFEERPLRSLAVHKLRYTAIEPKVNYELTINSKDIKLSGTKAV